MHTRQLFFLIFLTATPELMDKRMHPLGEGLFTVEAIVDIFVYGALMGGLAFGLVCTVLIQFSQMLKPGKKKRTKNFMRLSTDTQIS